MNDNQLNLSSSKMKHIASRYSLKQLIDEPTNFTENSSSLIDLILTNDINFVPYSIVGPPLLEQTRYHCPVIGFINAPKLMSRTTKRKIWLYNQGDFDEYRRRLSVVDWNSFFYK